MAIYSYVLLRDYGFAPNPFYDVCTLATCKPGIRNSAKIGDWILGFGSSRKGSRVAGKLIYAMKVAEKLSFDEYWIDPRFFRKRPVMNGSLKQMYGDNIYHKDEEDVWIQENSHHKNKDGTTNYINLNRDTGRNSVLISNEYWYWGEKAVEVPTHLKCLICNGRMYKSEQRSSMQNALEEWLQSFQENGYLGRPAKFLGKFEFYDGK